ncbi:hypothetical protein [Schlesneria sp. T3-172]|uniref:DUF7133 domain-containing protein n=1 Tax=Schlesneria sphaerica TaxID=3373610 RepID=UPI0037CA65B1
MIEFESYKASFGRLLMALFCLSIVYPLSADDIGVKVPDGFEVTEFAGDDLAHDIYSMTIDSKGRVVVSGAGFIKILIDNDGDGKADEAKVFSELPRSGAQGMCFIGRSLVCVGDGGLLRLDDANADDRADGPPDNFLKLKTGGEHDVHSVQQGPDGWWYVIAGNSAGINSRYATLPTSPIKTPRAGVLFRLKPDLTGGELLADGLRNAYDFAFNPQGDIFTYDSDEEREISLPWYRPTQVFHALTGADLGWVSKSWMRRDGFFDMPPVIASFGRGSPTGVACYRHTQFPDKYHGALFVLDWTYGRVHALPLQPHKGTWSSDPELFMAGTGQNGFAPTDVEIGQDGSLFVCVGGRGTRGAVYRIRSTRTTPQLAPVSDGTTPEDEQLKQILSAPQPLSSWSRAAWKPRAVKLGPVPFEKFLRDSSQAPDHQLRAIEILVELFEGIDQHVVTALANSPSEAVRARAIWAYGRSGHNRPETAIIKRFLDDPSPLVARCTMETCLSLDRQALGWKSLGPNLAARLGGDDRFNRALAAALVARLDESRLPDLAAEAKRLGSRAAVSYFLGWLNRPIDAESRVRSEIPPLAMGVLRDPDAEIDLKLDAVRLLQVVLGDMGPRQDRPPVFDGYASPLDLEEFEQDLNPWRVSLAEIFPSGSARLDEELVRLIAMTTTYNNKVIDALCERLTPSSEPVDDIHHLVTLARCPLTHSIKQREQIVAALVGLDEKITSRKLPQDASWADRIREMWTKLAIADRFLAPAIVGHPQFGRPGHTIFLNEMPPELLPAARDAFAHKCSTTLEYPWTNDVVFALGDSDKPEHRELIRSQFENFPVRGAVLVVLSRNPQSIDREKFIAGLEWSQSEVQSACLSALEQLGPGNLPMEQLALLKALRRLGADSGEYVLREEVVKQLERNNKQSFPFVTGKAGHRPQPQILEAWTKWIERRFPGDAAVELGTNDQELNQLKSMLAATDWDAGNAERGAEIFKSRACLQCHNGRSALGPDLGGVSSRFSREDLFTAIVAPSRDVSNRYQTTIVSTKEGKSYSGLIVYESVDGFLLRNSSGQTFRIDTTQVEEKRKSPISLMPTGLLKGLTTTDLADLYAYLRSIGSSRTP